jgi:hypothetical protein
MYIKLVIVLWYCKDSIFYCKANEVLQLFEQMIYISSSIQPNHVKKC